MNVLMVNDLSKLRPKGTAQQITSSGDVQSFASFGDAPFVLLSVRTQAISVTLDGATAADSAVGINIPANWVGVVSRETAEAMSIHQSAGGAATVDAQPMG